MQIAEEVTFGTSGLDRAAEIRGDARALSHALQSEEARVLPIWRGKPLVAGEERDHLAWLVKDHPLVQLAAEAPVFLGRADQQPRFAVDVSSWVPETHDPDALKLFFDPTEQHYPGLPVDYRFSELRGVMTSLSRLDAELAATARAVLGWHQSHRFCSKCGAESRIHMAGWERICPACEAKHFPRTDPVVIMLITRGNKVLIGRSPGWPEGMYSLLAGFIDPGETMEAAVRREVFEEAGITVGRVEYLSSQPWPFPSSLMFGCRGEATSEAIKLDPNELEDAVWISREEMMDVFAGKHPTINPARKGAIAHFLLRNWLADRLD
jgi:NAD+ diphosphatase